MEFVRADNWDEALRVKAEHPEALPMAGGTDVMLGLNFDHRRPRVLLDLTAVSELSGWERIGDRVRIGAGMPYTRIERELGALLPGLAMASRTVGSPQIRNRGTLGGNLGNGSPAADGPPPLLAADAVVEVESVRGRREIPIDRFFVGVKRTALEQDELIRAVLSPVSTGPQQFSKIGTRNAMVITVCGLALALHPDRAAVGTGIASAAPTPRRAVDAERFLAGELTAAGLWESREPLPGTLIERFGAVVVQATDPIDDVRGTANYRRHALSVLARRTLSWAWTEFRGGRSECA